VTAPRLTRAEMEWLDDWAINGVLELRHRRPLQHLIAAARTAFDYVDRHARINHEAEHNLLRGFDPISFGKCEECEDARAVLPEGWEKP
jgi:hypothetical protein